MPGVLLWGYYPTTKQWIPLQVDADGYVKVDMSAINLDDLGDVNVPAPADGDFFYYDDASGLWKSKAHADLTTGVHGLGISCRVTHSVNQTTTTGAMTTLAFDTEIWDTDNMHDNVTNNSRITFKTAGRYLIGLSVSWLNNATGERLFEIYKNGAPLEFTGSQLPPDAQNRCNQSGIMLTQFAVNDYIEAKVRQRSGGNLDVDKFYNASPIFWACCIEKL